MKERGVVRIETRKLIPHPENPRKNLGDLSEMTESIRKHGILQNLTAVPVDREGNDTDADHADKYLVIIGHRRLEAAKAAGVEEVPVRIVEGMTHEEQLITMLEENMQRSDLTIYDQAQSFQLMLDLGQTVEDIEEKSGFSKTTIYHRLNLAKLDKDEFKAKQDDPYFQLNLTDLIELEKIKSIDKRNEILKTAKDSANLKYLATQAARDEEKEENVKKIKEILEEKGIKQLPGTIKSWDCNTVFSVMINDPELAEDVNVDDGEYYYMVCWDNVAVLTPKAQTESEDKKESSEAYDRMMAARQALSDAEDELVHRRKDVLKDIVLGKLSPKIEETEAIKAMWEAVIMVGGDTRIDALTEAYIDLEDADELGDSYDDYAEKKKCEVYGLDMLKQFALLIWGNLYGSIVNIYGSNAYTVNKAKVDEFNYLDGALIHYGFTAPKEDFELLEGTSKLITDVKEATESYNRATGR